MKKRALIVVPANRSGGAEKICFLFAQMLSLKHGWIIRIVILAAKSDCFYNFEHRDNIQISYGKRSGRFGSELQLLKVFGEANFDLVFTSHFRVNVFLSLARQIGIFKCERLVTRESTVLVDRFSGLRLLLYRMGYTLYGGQDRIIAQTDYMASALGDLLPVRARKKILVIDNPIDVHFVRARAKAPAIPPCDEGTTLVWCGRLIDVKQPWLCVEVLAKLHDFGITVNLGIIGEGPLESELKITAKNLGVENSVVWMGHLENPFPAFSRSKIGLITSRSEGFPNVLLEMLACGIKSVVTTPCTEAVSGLPGVTVSSDFTVDEITATVMSQMTVENDHSLEIEAALFQRSPEQFAQRIIDG